MQIIVVSHLQLWADLMSNTVQSIIPDATIKTIPDKAQLESYSALQNADLAIVDLSLPDKESQEIIRFILNLEKGPEVFVSAEFKEFDLLKETLKYRVNTYIVEDYGLANFETSLKAFVEEDKTVGRKTRKSIKQWVEKNESFITTVKLSKREREILRLICAEKTSTEISNDLFISEHTVLTHRKNLLKKVGCKNTVGLVHYAYLNSIL